MNLQKRDCPIEIKITPCGAGWNDISWFVFGEMTEPILLTASNIGKNMSDFARALYYLCPNQFEEGRAFDIIETVDYAYDIDTKCYGKIYRIGESKPQGTYTEEFPIKAEFFWDEEPGGSNWIITRKPPAEPNKDTEFDVHVFIGIDRYRVGPIYKGHDYENIYDFDLKYSDLCYAAGKALTQTMKSSGLQGYWRSTSDIIDVIHLLFLKSVALGCNDACELEFHDDYSVKSRFSNEMELLLFDM